MARYFLLFAVIVGACLSSTVQADEMKRHVVIYNDSPTEVAVYPEESKDLWVTVGDLKRATKFELKPEGVCKEELCFPLPPGREREFLANGAGERWFNLSAFGRLLKQPSVQDVKNVVWYFGPRPNEQNQHLRTLEAPNFTLADIGGKKHSLADFRGKKVLLITWASW